MILWLYNSYGHWTYNWRHDHTPPLVTADWNDLAAIESGAAGSLLSGFRRRVMVTSHTLEKHTCGKHRETAWLTQHTFRCPNKSFWFCSRHSSNHSSRRKLLHLVVNHVNLWPHPTQCTTRSRFRKAQGSCESVIAPSCPIPQETLPNVANSVDVHSYRIPLGVCAGIAPFNFPATGQWNC